MTVFVNQGLTDRQMTVEECSLTLSIDALSRAKILVRGKETSGTWEWIDPLTKNQVASVDCQADLTDMTRPCLTLYYGAMNLLRHTIRLEGTQPHFGGVRWWFVCPLVADGVSCGRQVGRLYLPPDARYFGCRHCYDLTYRACRERRGRLERYRKSGVMFGNLEDLPYDVAVIRLLWVSRLLEKVYRHGQPLVAAT